MSRFKVGAGQIIAAIAIAIFIVTAVGVALVSATPDSGNVRQQTNGDIEFRLECGAVTRTTAFPGIEHTARQCTLASDAFGEMMVIAAGDAGDILITPAQLAAAIRTAAATLGERLDLVDAQVNVLQAEVDVERNNIITNRRDGLDVRRDLTNHHHVEEWFLDDDPETVAFTAAGPPVLWIPRNVHDGWFRLDVPASCTATVRLVHAPDVSPIENTRTIARADPGTSATGPVTEYQFWSSDDHDLDILHGLLHLIYYGRDDCTVTVTRAPSAG